MDMSNQLDSMLIFSSLKPRPGQQMMPSHRILKDHIALTGFQGSAPILGEAQFTVKMARYLPEKIK